MSATQGRHYVAGRRVFACSQSGLMSLVLVTCSAINPGAAHSVGGNLGGMTGLIGIPTAETLDDGAFRLGISFIDKRWVYNGRGELNSTVYSLSCGFLANLELAFRASVAEGSQFIERVDAPIVDRMGSARWRVAREGRGPAIALGIDDVRGTRFHHSLYLVATKTPLKLGDNLVTRVSVGYGAKPLPAARHVLDGAFGGFEVKAMNRIGIMLDFDTEKWNTGVRIGVATVTATAAFLGLDTFSGGVTWTQNF